jgi:hypothetical protein
LSHNKIAFWAQIKKISSEQQKNFAVAHTLQRELPIATQTESQNELMLEWNKKAIT